jgi:peptidylprolyl isomerase
MKFLVPIIALVAGVALVSCGGSDPSVSTPADDVSVVEVPGPGSKLKIGIPQGPPPKALEIKDVKRGSGPIAKAGDEVFVGYVGIEYETGKTFYDSWAQAGPSHFHLHTPEHTGWEMGVDGMKVGGRRELIIPSRLAYGTGALIYVVDLLGAKPWAS